MELLTSIRKVISITLGEELHNQGSGESMGCFKYLHTDLYVPILVIQSAVL